MIYIDKYDDVVEVVVDNIDNFSNNLHIKSIQTKSEFDLPLVCAQRTERYSLYKFYLERSTHPTPQPDVNYIDNALVKDGCYDYVLDGQIGLLYIGRSEGSRMNNITQNNNYFL